MAFPRPTLNQFRTQLRNQFQARFPTADLTQPNSVIGVLSDLFAGSAYSEFGYLDYIANQVIPDTAESDYLDRWAAIFGLTRNPPVIAAGNVIFNGVPGTVVTAGAQVIDSLSNVFTTQLDATIGSDGTGTTEVLANVPGAAANENAATPVTLTSIIANIVTSAAFDASGATGGADQEDDASLRNRLLLRIQQPPQGGSARDYTAWVLATPVVGATRAFIYPLQGGVGTVFVAFVCDNRPNIIPTLTDVGLVATYIDGVRPVTAAVTVLAPVAVPQNFTIHINPDTTALRTAVTASLNDMIGRLSVPGGIVFYSQIIDAVMQTAGITSCEVTTPSADVNENAGGTTPFNMMTLGVITWI